MADAYLWDFDRPETSSAYESDFLTWSVGVFQWLPKASGSGVKKSKTIRVMGYAADKRAIFDKATEICQKLNAENARIDQPPSWLQKTYSLPRPGSLPPEPKSDELTASQVRAVRMRVMRQLLIPAGFVAGPAGNYVRKAGNQLHLINFQASKYGRQYTVNLGFHYTFIPPLCAQQKTALRDYRGIDCALQTRVGQLVLNHDQWFPFGKQLIWLERILTGNAQSCLQGFEKFGKKWHDPAFWLACLDKREQVPRRKLNRWRLSHSELFLACIALECGQRPLAARMLQRLEQEPRQEFVMEDIARLRRKL